MKRKLADKKTSIDTRSRSLKSKENDTVLYVLAMEIQRKVDSVVMFLRVRYYDDKEESAISPRADDVVDYTDIGDRSFEQSPFMSV